MIEQIYILVKSRLGRVTGVFSFKLHFDLCDIVCPFTFKQKIKWKLKNLKRLVCWNHPDRKNGVTLRPISFPYVVLLAFIHCIEQCIYTHQCSETDIYTPSCKLESYLIGYHRWSSGLQGRTAQRALAVLESVESAWSHLAKLPSQHIWIHSQKCLIWVLLLSCQVSWRSREPHRGQVLKFLNKARRGPYQS